MGSFARDKATVLLTELYENRDRLARSYYNSNHWMRYSTAMRRRPIRPIYIGRRRLTAKRAIVVTPARNVRARGGVSKTRRANRARVSSRRNIGEPIGTASVKTRVDNADVNYATRDLFSSSLVKIPQGQGWSERERDSVNVRGFQVNFSVVSNLSSPSILQVNVAIIAPKNKQTVDKVDFFRSLANSADRAVDFGIGLTGEEMHDLPINSDDYTILKHKRYRLNNPAAGVSNFHLKKRWWIPLRRQINYTNTLDNSAISPVYLVHWYSVMNSAGGDTSIANAANVQWRVITFFRDTKA